MTLISHSFFPRSAFDQDKWLMPSYHQGPSQLDLFDPFDELDHMIAKNLEWLNRPQSIERPLHPHLPKVPQKYRITIDCFGYQPKSVLTEVVGNKLVVTGREEERHFGEDFSLKEFKKTFDLPDHADVSTMVSFMTSHGHLVIEMPLKEIHKHSNDDLYPRIVDGGTAISMKFHVPETIDPTRIVLTLKDNDLIVKTEEKMLKEDGISRVYYYKRIALPTNTDFMALKCVYDHHQIQVDAPLTMDGSSGFLKA